MVAPSELEDFSDPASGPVVASFAPKLKAGIHDVDPAGFSPKEGNTGLDAFAPSAVCSVFAPKLKIVDGFSEELAPKAGPVDPNLNSPGVFVGLEESLHLLVWQSLFHLFLSDLLQY